MKFRSCPIIYILGMLVVEAIFLALTVMAVVLRFGSNYVITSCAMLAVWAGFMGLQLYKALVFEVDRNGITIKRWGRICYVLPWSQIHDVGIQSTPEQKSWILYVSRYDKEGTEPLIAQIKRYDNPPSLPITLNYALFWRKNKLDETPILLLNCMSNHAEYQTLYSLWRRYAGAWNMDAK